MSDPTLLKMSRMVSSWERLVTATLQRDRTREAGRGPGQARLMNYVPSSLSNNMDIDDILRAAEELQDEDLSIARILCEHANSLALKLDPDSEGRGVLQFKTGVMFIIKQRNEKRGVGTIDKSQDINRLQDFYRLYRENNNVDTLEEEEKQFHESCSLTDELERKTVERKRVFATLKILENVLEQVSKQILEKLKHVHDSDDEMSKSSLSRVESSWERLVNATLQRDRTREAGGGGGGPGQGRLMDYVPSSLVRYIDAILRAANELQDEDPSIARILCEHANSLAQNLDPNSKGRGVLQFKTGLMSVIKQKNEKRDVGIIDRSQDVNQLQNFLQALKRNLQHCSS